MTWVADLRSAALIGTGRHAVPAPVPGLGFRPPGEVSPEELLLDQAALADVITRAARRPGTADAANTPDPAPADVAPPATGEAARLLDLLLSQPPVGQELRMRLVIDWLQFAARAGLCVPHRSLPAVLALAEARPAVAAQLLPAIGIRGRWLLGLGSTASGTLPGTAATGAGPKAAEAATELERLRRSDPAAARDRLREDWDGFSARERAAQLGVLATGLGPDDEGLLERALDEKAKIVRDAAAALLDRLPGSARAQRMATRLAPLLRVKGLLRRQFDIDLPPDPDPAAVRDGIAPLPRTGEPDRLGRLDTIIRGAPLDVWTTAAGRNPAAALAMLDREPRVVESIFTAAALRSDVEWARALLDLRADARLLSCLPAAEQEPALLRHINSGTLQPMALAALLRDVPRPWGLPLGNAVVELLAAKDGGYLAELVAPFLPLALPPDAAAQCHHLLQRSDDDASRRRVFRDVVQYQSFRQSLTEAFR
ncbi:DUF5691 domain-containing protein [Pseudarthrobacter sulfonivorans]|uniref:DUF5691 domain-containing protein n=1 Tax=Pseudarthrobacter sulfonivorans TaxID=121292 RepID=UPI00285FCB8A|nr:DUF5691 domain-containing protein [Pseudarthrobacter sulfonivorans]MDR6417087.1 hypothetical protein [Pseudarthrobacter sulfonivorans]